MRIGSILGLTVACAVLCVAASAQSTIHIYVDEWGNGRLNGAPVRSYIGQDPGPDGFANALLYDFSPFLLSWTVGGLRLNDATGALSDVIRWNQNGTMVFYSDLPEPGELNPPPADVGFPLAQYPNHISRDELGNEGSNGIFYVPNQGGDPGFVSGGVQVEYHIISDGVVPEPSSLLALLCGAGGLGGLIARRRR